MKKSGENKLRAAVSAPRPPKWALFDFNSPKLQKSKTPNAGSPENKDGKKEAFSFQTREIVNSYSPNLAGRLDTRPARVRVLAVVVGAAAAVGGAGTEAAALGLRPVFFFDGPILHDQLGKP